MTALNEQLTKVLKKEYVNMRSKEVKPEDALEILSKKYYLAESTVRQRLFDKKYGKRKSNKV